MIDQRLLTLRPRHGRRTWIERSTVLTILVFLLVGTGGVGSPAGAAPPGGLPAAAPQRFGLAVARQGREPFGDYVDRLSFDVTSIDPVLVSAGGPTTLTITGRMTNAGPEALTNLSYRFQRGSRLDNSAAVRQELAEPSEPTEQVPAEFTDFTRSLAAGANAPFRFTVSILDATGLAVSAPGVYPLMVNVNGAVTLENGPLEARVGELHLLLTVMSVPQPTSGGATAVPGTVGTGTSRPVPVNVVWPLVDRPHLGVGGVFLDDDLLAAIAPGGRLSTLADGLLAPAAAKLPGGSVTVVLDPQLLDELNRMTSAYRVVTPPAAPQPAMTAILQAEAAAATSAATAPTTSPTRTPAGAPTATATTPARTSTGPSTIAVPDPGAVDIAGTVAGTGQQSAASFLTRLRVIASRYPVLLLPYGDPDVVALVRAGLTEEVSVAVQHGKDVAARVLGDGVRLSTSMGYPINGAVDSATLRILRSDGLTTALLAQDSLNSVQGGSTTGATGGSTESAAGDASARVATEDAATTDAATTVPAAIAGPDVLSGVGALIDHGQQSGWAIRVNALTGLLAQQSLDGTVTPAVFTPDRRWSPDARGLTVLTGLLATLGSSHVIAGLSLPALAASGANRAVTAYPEAARAAELAPAYLERVGASRLDIASLRATLATTEQKANPALVLDPLDRALDAAASTAFRTDATVGEANLTTVEATTAAIRDGVTISSAGNSYTLASSTSPLVLTVQNNTAYDVPVRVQITGGERVGLTVNDPDVQVVPAGRSQQVKIPAEVSRSGQFQVKAQLVGPDGTSWGPPVQLSVESTAYGALTVVIIVVAGVVLVLMVALRIVQRLRDRRRRIAGLDDSGQRVDDADPPDTVPPNDTVLPGNAPPDELRDVIPAPPDRVRTDRT